MDEVLALKVISRLSEQGVKVPEDVSVITYNNSAFSTLVHPYLTTLTSISYVLALQPSRNFSG